MKRKRLILEAGSLLAFGFGLFLMIPPILSHQSAKPSFFPIGLFGAVVVILSRMIGAKVEGRTVWRSVLESLIIVTFAYGSYLRLVA